MSYILSALIIIDLYKINRKKSNRNLYKRTYRKNELRVHQTTKDKLQEYIYNVTVTHYVASIGIKKVIVFKSHVR
jgi:hypothetical protein